MDQSCRAKVTAVAKVIRERTQNENHQITRQGFKRGARDKDHAKGTKEGSKGKKEENRKKSQNSREIFRERRIKNAKCCKELR